MVAASRHTLWVVYGKRGLMLLAFALVLLLMLLAWWESDSGARLSLVTMAQKGATKLSVMEKPHYQGLDNNNRPFTVTADKATQLDKTTLLLEPLQADLALENDRWAALNAGQGVMHTDSKQLALTKGVEVFYAGGYSFRTDHADVDIDKGTAQGDAPVEGQGPSGTLKADRFFIENRGAKIVFEGNVKVTLVSKS